MDDTLLIPHNSENYLRDMTYGYLAVAVMLYMFSLYGPYHRCKILGTHQYSLYYSAFFLYMV